MGRMPRCHGSQQSHRQYVKLNFSWFFYSCAICDDFHERLRNSCHAFCIRTNITLNALRFNRIPIFLVNTWWKCTFHWKKTLNYSNSWFTSQKRNTLIEILTFFLTLFIVALKRKIIPDTVTILDGKNKLIFFCLLSYYNSKIAYTARCSGL